LILITGGLGPTKDDITKKVLCDYFDSKLVLNEEVLSDIQAYFKTRNKPFLEINNMQALLPEKATILRNLVGTASGMWFERNGKVFDIKHFENGTDGNQLLTTGTFDFINDTYKCNVRVIKD
jgi:nicotinamide-nucleotide amidase